MEKFWAIFAVISLASITWLQHDGKFDVGPYTFVWCFMALIVVFVAQIIAKAPAQQRGC